MTQKPIGGPTAQSQMTENTGGAEGIRTLDLLDAIEARSQLRHGPTRHQAGWLWLL
jgi:hypothetical protein